MKNELTHRLEEIKKQGLLRKLLTVNKSGPIVKVAGRSIINLSSNDYLGLSQHPLLREASAKAAQDHGAGSGAARLVTGTLESHVQLEEQIASLLKTERSIVFGSGYLAHLGTIPALMGKNDIIYSDELNHASIVDACRLSKSKIQIFCHKDIDHLKHLLDEDVNHIGQRLIMTESVFSMDGDKAPLKDICAVAKQYKAWVLVDEAHAFGVFGKHGRGLIAEADVENEVHINMGTLGKAAGSYGAFIAGSCELIEYLINKARTFIYSTALPPSVIAACLSALKIIASSEGDKLRTTLFQNAATLKNGLKCQNWKMGDANGPILPLHVNDPIKAVALADLLLKKGILVRAMRYPTVPKKTDRLRLVPSASLTNDHLKKILSAFEEAAEEIVL